MNADKCRPGVSQLALLCLALTAPALWGQPVKPPVVTIDWGHVLRESRTSPSLQVVVNPLLLRDSPIHDAAFKAVREMGADYVRYVPWLPYPKLAVAELEPPAGGKTSWDFSLIDPPMVDFMQANGDHPAMINFSTIPAWLFRTDQPVTYPQDPKQVSWTYTQGTELRPGGLKELGDYYARLVSWYVNGGFVDESGRQHVSGHRFKIPYWEVFNEPDLEHHMTPPQYTERYDAIVSAVRKVSPETKFVGISLALPSVDPAMFEYFLNPANHLPGVPLDMISYHFYALVDPGESATHWQYTFFDQADRFIATIRYIESIRRRLSPGTKVALNEIGAILPGDRNAETRDLAIDPAIPPEYWNAASALFAYIYVETAKLGIDVVSASQLVGFPTQYPSVTMIDWKTGEPNARYWSLKLLRDNFAPGDKLIATPRKEKYPDVIAQAFATSRGRKLLLINKRDHVSTIRLGEPVAGISIESVNPTTGPGIARVEHWSGAEIELPPFAVTVLNLGP
ncbi:MAG: hypothetical protein PSU94_01985 [Lacunisphaera sp.]|nr:hypothetical protein [Lacunisphaera sp.]